MLLIACVWSAGCLRQTRASLERRYGEARLQFQRGFDQPAQEAARTGYEQTSAFPDLRWKFRVLLAEIQLRKDKPSEALQLLGTEPWEATARDVAWRRMLVRGSVYCRQHEYSEAGHLFLQAERLVGADTTSLAELALFQGRCELSRKDFDAAEMFFKKAADSATAGSFTTLYALMGLGACALRRGQYEKAVQWYSQVRQTSHDLLASPFEERALGNLGYSYFELGDFEKARENSQAAEELSGKLHEARDQEKWLLDTGRAYHNLLQFALAQEYYKRGVTVSRQLHDDTITVKCLHNLVQMELLHGQLTRAEQYHAEARQLALEGDDLRDATLDEAGIAAAKHEWQRAEALFFQLLPQVQRIPRLTWTVQAGLARLFWNQGKIQQADEWFRKSISTMEDAALNMRRTEFKIAMLGNWPIFDDYIAFLEEQKRPEQALQVAQMARARTLAEQLGFKRQKEEARSWVRRTQAMLRARNSAILAYYESEHAVYLWAITPKRFLPVKLEVGSNELETLADSYTREIQEHRSLPESVAQQKLYQILLKPVHEVLPKGAHVILVADSALYRINLEALVSDEGALHYWIEDAELENASSIDLLLAARNKQRNGKGLLVIGAPQQETPEFPALPHAAEEMDSVRKHFPAAQVRSFSGKAATPEAYTSSNPGRFKYIEFATHGQASDSDPMKSSMVLSRGANGEFQLYASDLLADKLRLNAALVTYSACYGAGAVKTSSEGMLGLQWAFMRAGAHQVVAGLWDVDDESVPQLMGGLYEGVVKGQSASAALRAAKLKMLHAGGPHSAPYYWAPLQVYTGP